MGNYGMTRHETAAATAFQKLQAMVRELEFTLQRERAAVQEVVEAAWALLDNDNSLIVEDDAIALELAIGFRT